MAFNLFYQFDLTLSALMIPVAYSIYLYHYGIDMVNISSIIQFN